MCMRLHASTVAGLRAMSEFQTWVMQELADNDSSRL